MATSTLSTGGLIDPTKQAEYPIILGDRLAGKNDTSSQLVNIQYNHKTKAATPRQRSTITRTSLSEDTYNLTITDRAQNAEQSLLTYSYKGSVDPEQSVSDSERNLVLVFDPSRKAFVLEPVATHLNFNIRSAPAKTKKQLKAQYAQLKTLHTEESGDERASDIGSGAEDSPADDSNPYDFRHFLPDKNEDDKSTSGNATPEPHSSTSKTNTPLLMPVAAKPTPSPKPQPKSQPQTNPLRNVRQTKQSATPAKQDAATKSSVPPKVRPRVMEKKTEKQGGGDVAVEASKPPTLNNGTDALSSHKAAPSPGSNIIIDGDLIIDMGSPPPSRPAFKVNPAHFSSNNTPANDDGQDEYEDIEDLRLPSPAGLGGRSAPVEEEVEEDDDALAAEMEAAFEESVREEEARGQQSHRYHVPSDDESEVSEEE